MDARQGEETAIAADRPIADDARAAEPRLFHQLLAERIMIAIGVGEGPRSVARQGFTPVGALADLTLPFPCFQAGREA
jgi:hypothetical protein